MIIYMCISYCIYACVFKCIPISIPLPYKYSLLFMSMYIYSSNGKADSIRHEAETVSSFLYNTTTVRDTAFKGRSVLSTTSSYTADSTGIDIGTDPETDAASTKRVTSASTEPYKLHYLVHCINYETSEPCDVLITNGMTPNEYTASLYKKAKKIRRSIPVLTKLLEQATSQAAYLLDIQASVDALRSYDK